MTAIFLIVALLAVVVVVLYNRLIRSRNRVDTAWSDIDVQLQRRHDLVPRLVAAVDQYAKYERATLEAVTELRSEAMRVADVGARGAAEEKLGAGMDGEVKVEKISVRVKVRKSSGQPWPDPVTAELYILGKQTQTGYYGVIDVIKSEHSFTKENDNTFEFSSKQYSLPQTTGNINVGATYETYLVVIVDHEGKVVDTRAGRAIKEQGIAFIRELGPRTLFDRDGNVIGKAEFDKDAFSAAAAAATSRSLREAAAGLA